MGTHTCSIGCDVYHTCMSSKNVTNIMYNLGTVQNNPLYMDTYYTICTDENQGLGIDSSAEGKEKDVISVSWGFMND